MQNRFEFKRYIRENENHEEYTELRIIDHAGIRDILCLSEDMAGILLTTLFGDGIEPFLDLLEQYDLLDQENEEI